MLFSTLSVAEEAGSQPIRQIFEQETSLAHQPVTVKAWLKHRQVFQQEALSLMISTTSPTTLGKLNASIRTSEQSDWLITDIQPLDVQEENGGLVHQWQVALFAKHEGLVMLPSFYLQLEGKSMARKTLTLPSVSIRVLPLPFYLPKEVIVGKSLAVVDTSSDLPAWVLVGDRLSRALVVKTQAVQARSIVLPPVSGQGIQGLSPVLHEQDKRIRITQAWQIQDSGTWQVEDQHLWLFDPDTLKTTHLVIAGAQGTAIPLWLWRTLQTIVVITLLVMLSWFLHLASKWLKRYLYRQSILACQDASQLVSYLKQHYGYADTVVLSHTISNTHPDYTAIVALEGMLFGQEPLYGELFDSLKKKVASNAVRYVGFFVV